jgi:hypothetical protein
VDIAEALRPLADLNQPTIDLLLLDAFTKAMPENTECFGNNKRGSLPGFLSLMENWT